MWHVSSRGGVATLRTAIHLLLTYLVPRTWEQYCRKHRKILPFMRRRTYGNLPAGGLWVMYRRRTACDLCQHAVCFAQWCTVQNGSTDRQTGVDNKRNHAQRMDRCATHSGAASRVRLYDPCASTMRPYVELPRPLVLRFRAVRTKWLPSAFERM